jgi:hypothetical protein
MHKYPCLHDVTAALDDFNIFRVTRTQYNPLTDDAVKACEIRAGRSGSGSDINLLVLLAVTQRDLQSKQCPVNRVDNAMIRDNQIRMGPLNKDKEMV